MPSAIEKLKQTRWWTPTVRRYAAHLNAIKRQQCPELREPFIVFAGEVLNTPEAVRDDLLSIDPPRLHAAGPVSRYRQYESPTQAEKKLGVDRGRDASLTWSRKRRK